MYRLICTNGRDQTYDLKLNSFKTVMSSKIRWNYTGNSPKFKAVRLVLLKVTKRRIRRKDVNAVSRFVLLVLLHTNSID